MEATQNFVHLDPACVVASQWTDFDSDYYMAPEFVRLKVSIEHTGGNVSPIKVRPFHDGRFEIVLVRRPKATSFAKNGNKPKVPS